MIDLKNLKLYKGAPITIITALLLLRRNASQKELMQICGYGSDKPVRDALDILMQDHIVIKASRGSYMLAMHQLPLSWSETIDKLPSEQLEYAESTTETAESAGLKMQIEDLEARVSELEMIIGNRRKYGFTAESTGLTAESTSLLLEGETAESAVEVVESAVKAAESTDSEMDDVNRLINNAPVNMVGWLDIDTNQPIEKSNEVKLTTETAESADEAAEIPDAVISTWKCAVGQVEDHALLRGAVLTNYSEGRFTVALDNPHKVQPANGALREILEGILSSIMKEQMSVEFVYQKVTPRTFTSDTMQTHPATLELLPMPKFETYKNQIRNTEICNEYLLDPTGIEYSQDDMHSLISHSPDPQVLRFILRKATSLENAFVWVEFDLVTVKRKLLKKYNIINGTAAKIAHNENATLELIDKICSEAENTSLAIDRINKLSDEPIPEM